MNQNIIQYLKLAVALVTSFLWSALGGHDNLAILLLTLVCSDIVLGTCKGIKNKMFSSSILVWGVFNKAIYFVIIMLMVRVDAALGLSILRNTFIVWFCICDGASLIENSATLGVPWPDGILNVLVQVRKGFSINISKIVIKIIEEYGIDTTNNTRESE